MEISNKYGMYVALAVVFSMMLLYGWSEARALISGVVDLIVGPFSALGLPFFALVLILATCTGLYSSLVQKYTIDYDKMRDVQEKFKELNALFREAQRFGDEKAIKKMQARQQAMIAEQMEMSQQQFKPMAYILVLTVPIFFWLIEHIPQTPVLTLDNADLSNAIVLPFSGLSSYFDIYFGFFPLWILWYMLCSLVITQVIRKSLNIGGI
ncbi:MAG TPA: EMC3/TMCO1 family protein [Methanocorpusculum sp.]|nr:EMC3/TMCO1 family protein [Methanocorpusculum sp.]HJJ89725.1 EMC3/TMCO1 family protein [Methanocorpusculum sp.]HJJ90275.1 EMC3/TMCO1 family protein [Methanocorpusculum sp.]HJJ92223.1 EMC3/TMCO1 family protein [Methanocorpusculum sp.]HJK00788.1 EMC3/TMCO1 family protein [Methanocorpusculum sp.]